VQRAPQQRELAKLLPVLDKAGVNSETRQAAVWIVTDNADYDDLGVLVPPGGGSRVIGETEAARAMQLCEEAGIPMARKAIWQDRPQILRGLAEGDLKKWLEEKK
jgi:hypothetical protein